MYSPVGTTKLSSLTDLIAWQEGHKLVLLIYKELKVLPSSEKYNLIDQLQRAVVYVTSNIAEGFVRQSNKEKFNSFILPTVQQKKYKTNY